VIVTGESTNNQIGGMSLLGNVYATKSFERRPSGTVSGTYVVGSHTFKFGGDGRIEKFPNYVSSGVNANTTATIPSESTIPSNRTYWALRRIRGLTASNWRRFCWVA
jgi:hypothetical protein